MPSISFAAQSPCGGESIAIEAVAVEKNDRVQMDRIDDQLVVVRHAGLRWAYCSPHTFDLVGQDVRKATTLALERLGSRLADVDMRCEDVVRTWFFIGGILRKQGNSLHYEAFNRARAEVYQGVFSAGRGDASARDYPASTAVGADGRGVGLRAIAVKGRGEDRVAIPLENPRQTSAYAYDFDDPSTNPAFSRATVVGDVDCATIFISGTASIVGHETYHVEDVVAQTHETIDNIEALIAEANFQRHGLSDGGTSLAGLCQVHVFLKRGDDYAVVKAICEQRLGRVPMVFTVADLCRPGLLVEMDGVAICRHRG
jgi:enamine deaminase RidA (YjgF/YER057c/UK114 family)